MDWIRERLNAGQVAQVIAILERHRRRSEAVCIRTYEANADRMQYDLYRMRGLPVGSGIVVESVCQRIVGNRFKLSGCRWSKACATPNAMRLPRNGSRVKGADQMPHAVAHSSAAYHAHIRIEIQ